MALRADLEKAAASQRPPSAGTVELALAWAKRSSLLMCQAYAALAASFTICCQAHVATGERRFFAQLGEVRANCKHAQSRACAQKCKRVPHSCAGGIPAPRRVAPLDTWQRVDHAAGCARGDRHARLGHSGNRPRWRRGVRRRGRVAQGHAPRADTRVRAVGARLSKRRARRAPRRRGGRADQSLPCHAHAGCGRGPLTPRAASQPQTCPCRGLLLL